MFNNIKPDARQENNERLLRVEKALQVSYNGDLNALIDLIVDIRHYCDETEQDFHELSALSYDHYLVERAELKEQESATTTQ